MYQKPYAHSETLFNLAPKEEDESMALVHAAKQKGRYFIQKLLFSNYMIVVDKTSQFQNETFT